MDRDLHPQDLLRVDRPTTGNPFSLSKGRSFSDGNEGASDGDGWETNDSEAKILFRSRPSGGAFTSREDLLPRMAKGGVGCVVRCFQIFRNGRMLSMLRSGAEDALKRTEVQRATTVAPMWKQPSASFAARWMTSSQNESTERTTQRPEVDNTSVKAPEEHHLGNVAVDRFLPVNAFHLGRSIDLDALCGEFPNRPHLSQKDSLIISLVASRKEDWMKDVPFSECYMVAFKYGSIVFFNLDTRQRDKYLELATKHTSGKSKIPRVEEYGVVVRPGLDSWSTFEQDHLLLKRLDTNNIRVMSTVLAHTVALDHYAGQVDSMLDVFSTLNRMMEKTGDLKIKKKKLFQLIATNNTTLTDVITKLRLLERSDPAWRYAQYGKIWEGLRQEFEIEERFETLDLKLNLVQNNIKFFLEVLQNRKSDTLEWIIIILISGEICVSIYDLMTRAPGLSD